MRLLAAGLEQNLVKTISTMSQVTYTRTFNDVSELMDSEWVNVIDHSWDLILAGDLFHSEMPIWECIHRLRTQFPSIPIVILCKEHEDPYENLLLKRLSDRYALFITPCQLSAPEMADYLDQIMGVYREPSIVKGERLSPLIAGWGVSPKAGVTSILACAATSLAKRSNLKIGVLDLNFKSPELRDLLGLRHTVKDFLLIQSDLSSNMLVPQALLNVMVRKKEHPNVAYLLASPRREYAGLVTKGEIDVLLKVARSTFDVVFVDVNSYPDNAATLRALKQATEKWVITDPSVSSFQSSWRDWYENVFQLYGFGLEEFHLVVNKTYPEQSYSSQTIAKTMNLKLVGELPKLGYEDRFQEEFFHQIISTQNAWNDSLQSMLNGFTERMGWIDVKENESSAGWIKQLKFKMKQIREAMQ